MSEYHEPEGELSDQARDHHRALTSFKEEIEAIDWYSQRWAASKDDSLRALLAHNRDEEIEHACMALEWLRRNMPPWDRMLRTYLFTDAPITEIEKKTDQGGAASPGEPAVREAPTPTASTGKDLGIGSLRRLR